MTLSKAERAALVEALENDGNVTGCTGRLLELELVEAGTWLRLVLTPAGQIVAELIKENEATESLAGKTLVRISELEARIAFGGVWRELEGE